MTAIAAATEAVKKAATILDMATLAHVKQSLANGDLTSTAAEVRRQERRHEIAVKRLDQAVRIGGCDCC